MKQVWLRAWLPGICLLILALPARAVVVSGDFSGVIAFIGFDTNDSLGLGDDLLGQTISGHIAYQTALAPGDSDALPSAAEYHTPGLSPQWLTVTNLRIGTVAVPIPLTPAPPGSSDNSAQTVGFMTDGSSFSVAYQDAYQASTGEFVGLTFDLSLVGGPAFADQSLPLALDAADFLTPVFPTSLFALADPLAATPVDVQAAFFVTDFSLAAAGAPAPAALSLLGLGLAGLAAA